MANEYGMKTLPSGYQTWGAYREHGWSFTVNESIDVIGLRAYLPDTQTIPANLWVSDSNTVLRQVQITTMANTWCEALFSEKITLEAGKTYIVSCYTDNCYYTSNARSATYDSRISYGTGRYGSTRGARPNGTESNYIYPFIDIIIKGVSYKTNGIATLSLANYTAGGDDALCWTATTPEDTSLNLYTKVNGGSWKQVRSNGGAIADLPSGACTLQIKAEMTTTDNTVTPRLTSLSIRNKADKKILILTTSIPNFSSAIGNMTVSYDGLGGLGGTGGPTAAFTGTFTPSGLTWKGHQRSEEHIGVSVSANISNTQVVYSAAQEQEHLEATIVADVKLINVHDL